MYLSKLRNIFEQIAKCICSKSEFHPWEDAIVWLKIVRVKMLQYLQLGSETEFEPWFGLVGPIVQLTEPWVGAIVQLTGPIQQQQPVPPTAKLIKLGRISIGATGDKSETLSKSFIPASDCFWARPKWLEGGAQVLWRGEIFGRWELATRDFFALLGIQLRLYEISTGLVKYNTRAAGRE